MRGSDSGLRLARRALLANVAPRRVTWETGSPVSLRVEEARSEFTLPIRTGCRCSLDGEALGAVEKMTELEEVLGKLAAAYDGATAKERQEAAKHVVRLSGVSVGTMGW